MNISKGILIRGAGVGLCLVGAVAFARPGIAQQDPARAAFERGDAARREGHLEEAARAFEESLRLRPTASVLANLAATYQRMGRYLQAIDLCESILADRGVRPDVRLAAERTVGVARHGVARYRAETTPQDALLLVDGRSPRVAEGEVLLDPGEHVVTLSLEGYESQRIALNAAPGARLSGVIRLRELPARLWLEANVPEALLRIDHGEAGRGVLHVELSPGEHLIEASAVGYEPFHRSVLLLRGVETRVSANLVTESAQGSASLTTRWWFWTGVGVVVATGVALTVWQATRSPPNPCLSMPDQVDICR